MNDTAKVFKALSDDTRLRIVKLLIQKECCVCEVMQALKISETRASRNLNILYNTGFLKMRREGLWSLYSIDEENTKDYYGDLLSAVGKALSGNEIASEDLERLKKAVRVGPDYVKQTALHQNTTYEMNR